MTPKETGEYLETSLDRRSAVMSAMQHDLLSPLAALTYSGVLLRAADTDDERQRVLAAVDDAVASLKELLEQADPTDVARPSDTDAAGHCARAVARCGPYARSLGVRLEAVLDPAAVADARVLGELLFDLCACAVQRASRSGAVRVSLGSRGTTVAVTVQGDFDRAALWLCEQRSARLGGVISIEGGPVGRTVTVTVASLNGVGGTVLAANHAVGDPGVHLPVLVVDDDPLIVKVLELQLRAAGWTVLVPARLEDALSLAGTTPLAAVVLDIETGGVSERVWEVACQAGHPRPNLVVVTAHDSTAPFVARWAARSATILKKPWRVSDLIEAVGRSR